MSFEWSANPSVLNDSGLQEVLVNNGQPINFSDIFNGIPQFFAGSSFTVEEIIEIGVVPVDYNLLDIDFRWYPQKYYFGTWTIFDQPSAFGTNPESRGYLEDSITKLYRYSPYTIQANANVPIALHEQAAIDDCNFEFIDATIGVPPITLAGGRLFNQLAVLKSRSTLTKVPLLDRPFVPKIKSIGLYVSPGGQLTYINYKCRVINAISTDLPPFPLTVCNLVADPCEESYQLYLNQQNLVNPSVQTYYSTEAEAIAAAGGAGAITATNFVIQDSPFTCPYPPFTQYQVWIRVSQVPN